MDKENDAVYIRDPNTGKAYLLTYDEFESNLVEDEEDDPLILQEYLIANAEQ